MEAKSSKLLDLNSAKEIPDSHVWKPIEEDDDSNATVPESFPPVIDLNDHDVMEQVGHACRTWGAFQITNHGVPANPIDDMERAAKTLFALPLDQKLKAARSASVADGYGQSRYDSLLPSLLWHEGFSIYGSPLEHALKLWPHDNDRTKFCKVVEKYAEEMKKLAKKLMWLMLGSLGIVEKDIDWVDSKTRRDSLRLNSYPSCPDPDRAMGLMAHTDSTIFTILYQTKSSGLQIRPENSKWVTVPLIPNAFVINVGDLLHILSNGLYPSALHRVIVNRCVTRYSIAYFYGGRSDVIVSPLSKLVDPTHPFLYRAVNWMEYHDVKRKLLNKTLASIRVDYEEE